MKDGCIILVGLPTVLPNLSIGTSERVDVSHLDHCGSKVRCECALAAAVATHYGIGGATIQEQLLIGVEETSVLDKVLVVVVVEGCWRLKIKWSQVVVP